MSETSDTFNVFDRASIFLGIASIALAGFVFGKPLPTEFDFVHVGPIGAVVLALAGVIAIVGGVMRRPMLSIAAGTVLTVAAVVQLVGLAVLLRPLGGDASTMSVTGGLGIGLLTIAIAARFTSRISKSDER